MMSLSAQRKSLEWTLAWNTAEFTPGLHHLLLPFLISHTGKDDAPDIADGLWAQGHLRSHLDESQSGKDWLYCLENSQIKLVAMVNAR